MVRTLFLAAWTVFFAAVIAGELLGPAWWLGCLGLFAVLEAAGLARRGPGDTWSEYWWGLLFRRSRGGLHASLAVQRPEGMRWLMPARVPLFLGVVGFLMLAGASALVPDWMEALRPHRMWALWGGSGLWFTLHGLSGGRLG